MLFSFLNYFISLGLICFIINLKHNKNVAILLIYIYISSVKRLIVINRIQNKSFYLDMCVCCVYLL